MIEYCAFYDNNGERHVVYATDPGKFDKSLPPGRKWDYPDEVQLLGTPLIKREKTLDEMTPEERKRRKGYILFFAKDISLSYAIPKEFK